MPAGGGAEGRQSEAPGGTCDGEDLRRVPLPQICHSKSGEINPVKVGNLVRAYVDKYRHMRRHRRPDTAEEPAAPGAEA